MTVFHDILIDNGYLSNNKVLIYYFLSWTGLSKYVIKSLSNRVLGRPPASVQFIQLDKRTTPYETKSAQSSRIIR
jgi:hypothetical protein